ncbi:ClbS/DfsB family four-helix bundle protein [Xinfangfangia pollutisoli]|uniref:ClbS/DfsB family four-helix bundle protein n=1 Tax=Xinfangfangia pollutisoli TaxID=2865960 RepID=UPI001CD1D42F|nr:ClbS/DfsB family four-helix bundle protein [Xinfangfangia pollutisoli]
MAVPASRQDLLAAIATSYDKLAADLALVPPARAREASLPGHSAGTVMSPADLVAYLIGWNELVLKWLDRDDRGETVDFPETGYKWNQLGQLAQRFYADHRDLPWPDLLARLARAKAGLVDTIAARTDEDLYGRPWYGKWTKGRMIQFNSAAPYANARARIRAWRKPQPGARQA